MYNRFIHKVFFIVILSYNIIFTQKITSPILKKYSFGTAIFVGDGNINDWYKLYSKIGIIDKNGNYLIAKKKIYL